MVSRPPTKHLYTHIQYSEIVRHRRACQRADNSLPSLLHTNPLYPDMGVMRSDAVVDGLIAESEPVVQDRVLQDR